jgi:hypothetical protein
MSGGSLLGPYTSFLAASSTASAAFGGLLFVGFSIVSRDDASYGTRERRIVLAASSFLALVDIFFTTLMSLLGSVVIFGIANLIMATVGLLGTSRLMPRARRAGNFAPGFTYRWLNLSFAAAAVALYSAQAILAVLLLARGEEDALIRALAFVIVGLFASALGRAWEVAGIGHSAQTEHQH